jgi:hypothetical protein
MLNPRKTMEILEKPWENLEKTLGIIMLKPWVNLEKILPKP